MGRHHREGKTNEITGRFFEPRTSYEFYDNENDFDNVNNLIDCPDHQHKIAELSLELRKRQLLFYDSGLLPEQMRERRAAANNLTIYEMVRDEKLYPLKSYLDASDLALSREKKNLNTFISWMAHPDEGLRWWAVNGLLLPGEQAAPATTALEKALDDDAHEIRIMAAWTLVKLGQTRQCSGVFGPIAF